MGNNDIVPLEAILYKVYSLRGINVMLDRDLADLYGVPVKRLNEQVKRNKDRFPAQFMFRLTNNETHNLRSQIATTNFSTMSRSLPYAFTEHGVLMLSSILNSPTAIRISIQIIDAFVKLRQFLSTHEEFRQKLLEHDSQIRTLFDAIDQLMSPAESPVKKIGFR